MKEFLKNQTGAVIVVIIIVLVLATAGGGAAFLAVRMVVSGDGNFLQPFEELGWIDPKEDSSSEDDDDKKEDKTTDKKVKDDEDEEDNDDEDKTSTSESGKSTEYLLEESRLSSEAKESGVEHYYGDIGLSTMMEEEDDEFADLYSLMKAGVNLYAKDGKVVEIVFGFDITDFCEEAYKKYPDEFKAQNVNSATELQTMMIELIDSMYDSFGEEYSDYISKYTEGGVFQLYITEKGFESLYETYDIKDGENDLDKLKEALEDSFDCEIKLVED